MRRFVLLGLGLLCLGGLGRAQASGRIGDRIEVFGGYAYASNDFTLETVGGLNGWNAAVNFKARPWIGVAADFSGFYPSLAGGFSAKALTLAFGPQVSWRIGRVTPFGHFLIGDIHVGYTHPASVGAVGASPFTSDNSLAYVAGGGVDFGLTRRLALRGEVDWLHSGFKTNDNQRSGEVFPNVARISTGIVFRF